MRGVLQRVIVLVAALGVTLAMFLFWGRFGNALRNAMVVVYAEPKPAAAPPTNPNEVTAIIVPAQPAHCDRAHPCPPPKP
jgi:hypothetical protein